MDGTLTLLLIFTVCGAGWGQASISPGQTPVTQQLGESAALSCTAENLGSGQQLDWVLVKHSVTIFNGDQLMVPGSRFSTLHPEGSNTYTLVISRLQASDQGVYRCEINGTTQAATVELIITDSGVPPEVDNAPDRPLNRTGCCEQRGVSEACLPACAPSTAPADTDFTIACALDVESLVYCGSDGRNHENCCARSGVPAGCLFLCSNDAGKMQDISMEHIYCLNYSAQIISCYEYGGALLPTAPVSVSVLVRSGDSLLVSWREPEYNPSAVSGYIVFYKKQSDTRFRQTDLVNANTMHATVVVDSDTMYSVYVVAVGHHGSSQPSETINIFVEDNSPSGQATDVLLCCQGRQVSEECQQMLCHPQTWRTFNYTALVDTCWKFLPDVFSCLAGERNNTGCCQANHVAEKCVPMCSGSPPPFDSTLAVCLPKLPFIEACIQEGLSTQPEAPSGLNLQSVTANTARLTWARPSDTGIPDVDSYIVQLRRGGEQASWVVKTEVTNQEVDLTDLVESESYAVRVISKVGNFSSLPSATIRFRTFPATTNTERPTVAHNLTACCEGTGMPSLCSQGCEYAPNMTAYYRPILDVCAPHIGSVLSCAADGRDHTACCRQRNVSEVCYGMCVLNSYGPLDPVYFACLGDTARIVMCFEEGVEDLVRMPDDVVVTNVTSHTITVEWKNPRTGPSPDHYVLTATTGGRTITRTTTSYVEVLQNLSPGNQYTITVTSYLSGYSSPPTAAVSEFTPALDSQPPFAPGYPDNSTRALWNNRTHCCQSNGISEHCQPACLNQPSPHPADCSADNHKILTCAADGKDHSLCCAAAGLPDECLPLCSSHASSDFTPQLASCMAEASLTIITSCFLDNSGLVPSAPTEFRADGGFLETPSVTLEWTGAGNCDASSHCAFDAHYWRADSPSDRSYTTVLNVTSPFVVRGLTTGGKYTFTVTARNDIGSGPAAPWNSLFFGILSPDLSVAQRPELTVFDQGSSMSLICDLFNVRDAASFTWQHRGRPLSATDRELQLNNVDRRSEGIYSCTIHVGDFTASAQTYLNVRYKPEYNFYRVVSAPPGVNAQAVLEFWFRGHPNSSAASVWSKDGQPVGPSAKHSFSSDSDLTTGITSYKLMIDDVEAENYGMYQCSVSNQYGSAVAHTRLTNPSEVPTAVPPTPSLPRNVSNCCRARGVIDTCMPLCTFEISISEAFNNPDRFGICLVFFQDFVECVADGADHSLCCEREGVPHTCLPLCQGQAGDPNSPDLPQCVDVEEPILNCMETGYEKIPTAPLNVMAMLDGTTINVTWNKPSRNADLVTSYNLYYNHTGDTQRGDYVETITSTVGLQHQVTNVVRGQTYYLWMTAQNSHGRSHVSNIVSVSVPDMTPLPESDEEGLTGGQIAGITIGVIAVIIIVVVVAAVLLMRRGGPGKQRLVDNVAFDNAGYDKQEVRITSLPGSSA